MNDVWRDEDTAPAFVHFSAAQLPQLEGEGARARLVAGEFFGWRPAGAALQAAIAAASPRRYQHPVTDFNNDSVINFATIQAVVDDAIHRVGSKLGTR